MVTGVHVFILLIAVQSTASTRLDKPKDGNMMGGVGTEKEADENVQKIVDDLKSTVEEKTGHSYDEFKCVKFATQVVAGTNYFVKVKVGDNNYIHLRIYAPLPHTHSPPELTDVMEGKSEADPISYF
ncbi:cystatin-B-like [Watersipora subatra]|uniref:cystatin-B-like n=1 Tax=Watersipora subatra TaxID=2589382 RepID=UPI00355AD3D3